MLQLVAVLLGGGHFKGINRKIQLKPLKVIKDEATGESSVQKALFILKWGGEISHSGLKQAEEFGKFFRENFYINCNEGLLRLHSTYRHDMKVYSADEGRCQRTAASFTKGLLMIEDDLTPILSSFVNSDPWAVKMLDVSKSFTHQDFSTKSDKNLHVLFASEKPIYETPIKQMLSQKSPRKVKIQNPLKSLKEIDKRMSMLCNWLGNKLGNEPYNYYVKPRDSTGFNNSLFCGEDNSMLVYKRWMKLDQDFFDKETGEFDLTKLPDILDSVR